MYNFAEYGFATLTDGNTTWWPNNVLSLVGIAEKVLDNLVVLKDALILSKLEGNQVLVVTIKGNEERAK